MLCRSLLLACLAVVCAQPLLGQQPVLKLERAIALPDVAGRIDHLSADVVGQRIFLSALGSDEVEVLSLREGKRIARIESLQEPQGVLYLAANHTVYVANGGDGTVRSYDARTLEHLKTVSLGEDADNLRFDAAHQQLLAGYGSGAIAVLSLELARVRDLRLPVHPEAFEIAPNNHQIFVNLPANRSIGHIDLDTMAVNPDWAEPSAGGNFPMALDAVDGRLLVACRQPGQLLLLDTANGKILDHIPTAGDADDLFFDANLHIAFVIGGEGYIDVVDIKANKLTSAGHIATASGARTGLFIPEWNRLIVAAPRRGDTPARLLIFTVSGS